MNTEVTVQGTTRNNYKILSEHPRMLTEINASGPRVSLLALKEFERRLLHCTPSPRCVALSGSLPPGVPTSIYARWIRAFHKKRIPVLLDTSGISLVQGMRACPWVIKPNRHEAEELLGMRITSNAAILKAAGRLLRRGPEWVLLSMGARGALLAGGKPQQAWWAQAPSIIADSPVGAGDSMVAGFLIGWARKPGWLTEPGKKLDRMACALKLGIAAGTATSLTAGTELCKVSDVRRLAKLVVVKRVL